MGVSRHVLTRSKPRNAILAAIEFGGFPMATAKKKSTKKRASSEVSWSDTMRKALENKKPPGGFPDQGKPRDSVVKKVRKDAF
jgi:hypothetical protein